MGRKRLDLYFEDKVRQYYANNQPFGVSGDFITSPHISQLFGEMVAFWIIDKSKSLKSFAILELGPGTAVMMDDIIRTISNYKDIFSKLTTVWLLEESTMLQSQQKALLQKHNIQIKFLDNIEQIKDIPNCLVIANEFFDAIALRQFKVENGLTYEVYINDRQIEYDLCNDHNLSEYGDGVYEVSQQSLELIDAIAKHSAAGLIIDYGYFQKPKISTLQAVSKHKYANIFTPNVDLTYLVDFIALADTASRYKDVNLMTQSEFLLHYGIMLRAAELCKNNKEQAENIMKDVHRLISTTEMGELFKALILE